jgi:hypothetical protein
MAFSAQPQINSHKTDYLPFQQKETWWVLDTAGVTSTSPVIPHAVNMILETDGEAEYLRTRPGFVPAPSYPALSADLNQIRQLEVDGSNTLWYSAFVSGSWRIYYQISPAASGVLAATLGAFPPDFTFFRNIAGVTFLVACAPGWGGIVINTQTLVVTTITDPDYNINFGYPVALDNYIFVVRVGTSDIYQSNFDDPLGWTAGNFITADLTPGTILHLTRIKNYLAVFKTGGVEFFYNAGNPSGSVLAQYESFFKEIRISNTPSPAVFPKYNEKVFFVGADSLNKVGIYSVDTTGVELFTSLPLWQKSLFVSGNANRIFFFELLGVPYIQVGNVNITGIYNLITKAPLYLTLPNNSSFLNAYFWQGYWYFLDNNGSRASPRVPLWVRTTGLGHQDYDNVNINYIVHTGEVTHGTYFTKTCSRCVIDVIPFENYPNPVTLSWNTYGTDSASFNTTERTFSSFSLEASQPSRAVLMLKRLGRYRKRFYKFTFQGALFKLKGALFDIDIGTN